MIKQVTITKIDNGWIVADDGTIDNANQRMLAPRAYFEEDVYATIDRVDQFVKEGIEVPAPKIIK